MNYYLCSSIGNGFNRLTSFDNSLFNSGISNYNLVKVSSILPKYAERKDSITLDEGSILYTAYAFLTTNIKGEKVSAGIAVGIPKDKSKIGVIMEYSDYCSKEDCIQRVKSMVLEAMNTRSYEIEKILYEAQEVICNGDSYQTVLAALSMWY